MNDYDSKTGESPNVCNADKAEDWLDEVLGLWQALDEDDRREVFDVAWAVIGYAQVQGRES